MLCSKRNDVVLAEPHLRGNGEKERKSGERDNRGTHVNRFLSFLSVLWSTENAKMAKTVETANREKRQFASFISVFR